jgi:SPP1 gp7 family putative phage head morphogenesis protein
MSQELIDYAIQTQILLERYKQGLLKEISPSLLKLAEKVKGIVLELEVDKNSAFIIKEINDLIDKTYDQVKTVYERQSWQLVNILVKSEAEVLGYEPEPVIEALDENSSLVFPMILGATWASMWAKLIRDAKYSVASSVRRMLNDGESIASIANTVSGTKKLKYKNGLLNKHFSYLFSTIKTSIQALSSSVKTRVWRRESVKKYRWISVLDSRTTAICRGRSNKVYEVGKGPTPPAHMNCRSIIVPYSPADEVPESYSEWLRRQPKETVQDILGKEKADLFMKKEVTLDKFTANGRELTIDELRQRLDNN